MTPNGSHLEGLWSAAQARPADATFRSASTGVETPHGPVLAAVQSDGVRHLLVPIDAKHTLREDLDGRAVTLRRRVLEDEGSYRTYAALALIDENQKELFTALCSEVLVRITETPRRAVSALRRTLVDWRSLLSGSGRTLGPSELAGLFGELTVLQTLVALDPGAVGFWTGHSRTAQDFHRGSTALEVKATASPEGRVVRIHGVGQLDGAGTGRLLLTWFRLSPGSGRSVPDLVDEILAATDDEHGFLTALLDAGYRTAERDAYTLRTFDVAEQRTYEVGPGFPRITPSGLTGDAGMAGVDDIHYDLDLDSAPAHAALIEVDPAQAFMERP
ncbi:PD-(D/E)XK motif protein [Actinomycetospora sp. C-140]